MHGLPMRQRLQGGAQFALHAFCLAWQKMLGHSLPRGNLRKENNMC